MLKKLTSLIYFLIVFSMPIFAFDPPPPTGGKGNHYEASLSSDLQIGTATAALSLCALKKDSFIDKHEGDNFKKSYFKHINRAGK